MDKNIINAINDYYSLKQEYETNFQRRRRTIQRNKTLTKDQKRKKLLELRNKCINCGKEGETLFSNKKGILKAICGNTSEKCSLNIEINVGKVEKVNKLYGELSDYRQSLRSSIIRDKLDLLFGYIDEEEAIGRFNESRKELIDSEKILFETEQLFNDVVHNDRNKKAIQTEEKYFIDAKQKMKNLSNQYQEEGSKQLIRDMVELYKEEIIPIVTRLRNLKYSNNTIECSDGDIPPCNDGIYRLIQDTYTLFELELPASDELPSVISYVK